MNKKILLFAGLILREFLSFWTGHPYDFEVWVRVGHYVAQGSNPYTYLYYIEGISFAPYEALLSIGYPPLWALICGLMYSMYYISSGSLSQSPLVYYFLIKQPVILGDLLVGIIFCRWFAQEKLDSALVFWILNPMTIILSSVWGMFDSLTLALLLLSIKFVVFDKKDSISGVLLGIATSLKLIPLIFAPIGLKFAAKKRQFILSYSLAILLTAIFPFFVFNWSLAGFYHAMESQAVNIREQPAVGGMTVFGLLEPIMILWSKDLFIGPIITPLNYLWIVAFSVFYAFLYLKPANELNYCEAIRLYIIAALLFLLTRLYIAEQYVLYVIGLMIIDVFMFHLERKTLLDTICILSLTYLVINNTLLVRFLSPVAPWAFSWDMVFNNSPPSETIRHIFRLLAGFIFYASTLQLFYIYSKDYSEQLESWVVTKVKNALKPECLKYYLYLFLLTINALFLDYVIVNMIKDWQFVLNERFALNLPLFGLYHLLLLSLTVGFDVSVCLFMAGSLEERLKAFARLMLLNMLMIGIAQPLFQVLCGKPLLSGEPTFVLWFLLDERILVGYSVIGAIIGLIIVEDVFKLIKEKSLCERLASIR